jgi:hypothetical protein
MPRRSLALLPLAALLLAGGAMLGSPRGPAPVAPEPSAPAASASSPPVPAAMARTAAEVSPCRTPDRQAWRLPQGELRPAALAADRAGNIYLAGGTRSPDVAFLGALGPGGGKLFAAELGEGVSAGVAVDLRGDVLVIGSSRAPRAEGAEGRGTRAFVARVGAGGGLRFRREIGAPGDEGRALAVDAAGNLAALVEGARTATILALDADAGARWTRVLGGGKARVRAGSLAVGPDGGVVVGGAYEGSPDLGGGPLPAPKYSTRPFVLALDAAGAHRFSAPLAGPTDSAPTTLVAVDAAGRVVAVTSEDGQPDGVVGYATVTVILGLDAAGKPRFEERLRHDARPGGLALDAAGNLVVAGHHAGALELGGRVRLPSGSESSGFVLSLDPAGALRFAVSPPVAPSLLALLPSGDVVLATSPYAQPEDRFVSAFCPPSSPPGPGEAPQPRVRAVRKRYALPEGAGHVELLLDARLEAGAEKELGCFFWSGGAGPGFHSPPLGAALRLVDASGQVLDQVDDDHAMGTAEPHHLYGDDRLVFAFTVNDSPCAGKRRGLVTTFREPVGGKLRELRDQRGAPVSFTSAMTGAARIVPAREGPGKDILTVRSLDFSGPGSKDGYITFLARYAFVSGRWVRHEKRVPGEWQDGAGTGSFPARKDFP